MEKVSLETMNTNLINLVRIVEKMKEDLEDRFLTAEEEIRLEQSLKEFENRETFSLEDVKKELNL